jgi:hypothetical protein
MDTVPENVGVLAKLSAELHYLIEPVLRYGCRTEWDAFDYLDNATQQQMLELADIAERVLTNDHYPVILKFLDKYQITDYAECAKLYFFFGLLDYGGLTFDRVPEDEGPPK